MTKSCLASSHSPDSIYSWLVCLGASVSNGMAHAIVLTFGVLLPVFMKEFHQTREVAALIGSLTFGLALFLALASGKVCHRFGCRLSHTIGTLLCAASLLITSWATGVTYMFFSFSLMYGAAMSLIIMSCFLIVSVHFDKRRSLAIGIVSSGGSAASFVVGPTMEALVQSLGWRNTLRILSGIIFSTCFISILFSPNDRNPPRSGSNQSLASHDQQFITPCKRLMKRFSFCKLPEYIIPAVSLFIVSFVQWSLPIHLVRHCLEIGITSKKSSYLYLGIGFGSFVCKIGAGKLCEIIRPVYLYQIGDILSAISSLVLATTASYPVLVVITVLYGLADGIFNSMYNVMMLTCVDQDERPYAYGCANTMISVAVSIGPMITGLIADRHSYRAAFIMVGIVTIIGGLLPFILICFKTDQKKDEQQKIEDEILLVYDKVTVL